MSNTDTDPNAPPPNQTGYLRDMGPGPQQPPSDPTDVPEIPFGYRRMEPSGVGPFNPYIPSGQNPALRRPPRDIGTDDWVMRSMNDGVMDGMHIPQERDMAPIFHSVTMGLGQWAPPMIAMPAIAGGRFYGTAMNLYAKNMVQQANMARKNAQESYKIAAARLKEYKGRIGDIYAAYGPSEDDPKSSDRWHQELYNLAREYGDHKLQAMLERGEYDQVDKLVQHLDGHGSDLDKAIKRTEYEEHKLKLKALQDKAAASKAALDIYRKPSGTGEGAAKAAGVPAAGSPPSTPTAPDMPPGVGSRSDMGPAPPDSGNPDDKVIDLNSLPPDKPKDDTPDVPDVPDTPETPATPEASEQPDTQESAATPSTDEAAATPSAGAAPVRLAQADTGTMSDAAPPGAATLAAQAKARGAPVMAADDDEEPSPAPTGAPAAGAGRPAPPSGVPLAQRPSPALEAAHKGGFYNDDAINGLALQDVNGTLKIQQARAIPPELRPFVQARSAEMAAEFRRILKDPNIKGEQVYTEIAKFNPEFAEKLRGYVDGKVPPPASAWSNAAYSDRVVGLGNKVDPSFNYTTFAARSKTIASFTSGIDGRNVTAVGTAKNHTDFLRSMVTNKPGSGRKIYDYLHNRWVEWTAKPGESPDQAWLAKWNVSKEVALTEVAKALSGGPPHQAEMDQFRNMLEGANNTEQLNAALDGLNTLLAGRLDELKKRYDVGTGRDPIGGMRRILQDESRSLRQQPNDRTGDQAVIRMLRPPAGFVKDGWRFKGGDPGIERNWEQVQ